MKPEGFRAEAKSVKLIPKRKAEMLKSQGIGAEISVSEKRNTVSEDAKDEDEVDYEVPTTKGTLMSAI